MRLLRVEAVKQGFKALLGEVRHHLLRGRVRGFAYLVCLRGKALASLLGGAVLVRGYRAVGMSMTVTVAVFVRVLRVNHAKFCYSRISHFTS